MGAEARIELTALPMRNEVAFKRFGRAVDRFHEAERELTRAMAELGESQKEIRQYGVIGDVEMLPATRAAWVEFQAGERRP